MPRRARRISQPSASSTHATLARRSRRSSARRSSRRWSRPTASSEVRAAPRRSWVKRTTLHARMKKLGIPHLRSIPGDLYNREAQPLRILTGCPGGGLSRDSLGERIFGSVPSPLPCAVYPLPPLRRFRDARHESRPDLSPECPAETRWTSTRTRMLLAGRRRRPGAICSRRPESNVHPSDSRGAAVPTLAAALDGSARCKPRPSSRTQRPCSSISG